MSQKAEAISVSDADWFKDSTVQSVLSLLNADGGEARVAGGAVRNSLMDQPVGDIDIATTLTPEIVIARAQAAGIKSVPTGLAHGTVTLVAGGQPFEVTTLRVDVSTDGRHAEVAFGADWRADAQRRDLTMNGLYADASGDVVDLVGGIEDIRSGTVRFIGDAAVRIEEDHLRILRFFRFFAWYGTGRPDADGLRACARLKSSLTKLSAERVWSELKRLLSAPDPSRSMLWMRQSGVLSTVLEESEKWGIDSVFGVVRTESALGWGADPLLRLMAIIPPDEDRIIRMSKRLRLSRAETLRLISWANQPEISDSTTDTVLRRYLYQGDPEAIADRIKLRLCVFRVKAETEESALAGAAAMSRMLKVVSAWKRPELPVTGNDLLARGIESGPNIGRTMARLEDAWVESNFHLTREELLGRLEVSDG